MTERGGGYRSASAARIAPLAAALAAMAAAGAGAQERTLQTFRAPLPLEEAYVGLAADLDKPELCARISPDALNRVRKPVLTRALCYYHVAVAEGDTRWCDEVSEIPLSAGLMSWLDADRCRYQVGELASAAVRPRRPIDYAALFPALGYGDDEAPASAVNAAGAVDWRAAYVAIQSGADVAAAATFFERLDAAPDFAAGSDGDGAHWFTEAEANRESAWVLNRALRLCVSGLSDANCDDTVVAMLRESNLVTAGVFGGARESAFRPASGVEIALAHAAEALLSPDACDGVSPHAAAIGWSLQSGLGALTVRSACRMRVAAAAKDDAGCAGVAPIANDDLDGWAATEETCRERIAADTPLFPRSPDAADWPAFFAWLGYDRAEVQAATGLAPSEALLARLANPFHDGFEEFRDRVAAHAAEGAPEEGAPAFYSEVELQRRAYQMAATQFHCAKTWADIPEIERGTGAYAVPAYARYELTDQTGARVDETAFAGEYALYYFGFTYCPDVCPTSLSTMMVAEHELEEAGLVVRPVFVTLDAQRDTPDVMADYVGHFSDDFVGLTGSAADIRRAARAFNVYYFAGEQDGEYVIEHTSYFYLVDPEGRTVKYFDYGVNPYDMAAEVIAIIGGDAPSPAGSARAGDLN